MSTHQIKHVLSKFFVFFLILSAFAPQTIFAQSNPNSGVEALVRASFPDMPDMISIAKCESGFRQFAPDGSPLRGGTGGGYVGIFQLSDKLHRQNALNMAYDINTVNGNIAYARHMFFKSGSNPWKSCLTSTPVPAPAITIPISQPVIPAPVPQQAPQATSALGQITSNLNMGMTNGQVLLLQQILNRNGFVISASGPGSPGNETSYFGSLTREAVKKFQCEKSIACSGNESTTGYGNVGPKTRAALN